MEQNRYNFFFLFICLFLSFNLFLFAEDTENKEEEKEFTPGYFVDSESEQPRIIQRLVWDMEEYAHSYTVTILFDDIGPHVSIRETVNENYIEVSLAPGRYRYNVTTYDFLGRLGAVSDWKEFLVLAAFQPHIERFYPEQFFLDQRAAREINITGINLLEDSEVFLRSGNTIIRPTETAVAGRGLRLLFKDSDLTGGTYRIFVINPGGFETHAEWFVVGYRKPLDIFIKLAINPVIPIYGELNDLFGANLFLTGASFAFEVISSKRSTFNGGLELYASAYFLHPDLAFNFNVVQIWDHLMDIGSGAAFADFGINISLQKRFNYMRNAVTFRFGLGMTLFNSNGIYANIDEVITAHMNACISLLFLVTNVFHFDVGVDYAHYLLNDHHFGLIKPRLGIALKF